MQVWEGIGVERRHRMQHEKDQLSAAMVHGVTQHAACAALVLRSAACPSGMHPRPVAPCQLHHKNRSTTHIKQDGVGKHVVDGDAQHLQRGENRQSEVFALGRGNCWVAHRPLKGWSCIPVKTGSGLLRQQQTRTSLAGKAHVGNDQTGPPRRWGG